MYSIISEGRLVSLCDEPRYIKMHKKNGAYVEADKSEAIGISVNGTLYNINGGSEIPNAPEAIIKQDDVAEYVFRNRVRIFKSEESTNAAIIEIQDALCELDAVSSENLTTLENALCELDGLINGGETNE